MRQRYVSTPLRPLCGLTCFAAMLTPARKRHEEIGGMVSRAIFRRGERGIDELSDADLISSHGQDGDIYVGILVDETSGSPISATVNTPSPRQWLSTRP
jgi:hypothetical protein